MPISTRYSLWTLGLSWGVCLFLAADPERLKYFPFVGLVPMALAVIFRRIYPLNIEPRSLEADSAESQTWRQALLAPIAIVGICAAISIVMGYGVWQRDALGRAWVRPSGVASLFGLILLVGQEWSWRATFDTWIKNERKGNLTGPFVWAAWHAPIFVVLGYSSGNGHPIVATWIQVANAFIVGIALTTWAKRAGILPGVFALVIWNALSALMMGSLATGRGGAIQGELILIHPEGLLGLMVMLFGAGCIALIKKYRSSRPSST